MTLRDILKQIIIILKDLKVKLIFWNEQLQLMVEILRKENEALKAYIKSGEKIIKL